MRVGIISPNVLNDFGDSDARDDSSGAWPFESLAKRTSLLFDKIFLTENLQLTCEIVGGGSACCDEDVNCETLRYLAKKGLILLPQDLGYECGDALLKENMRGTTARLHRQLLKVGNPSNNCGPGEYTYVGQPDIGDIEAHDGNHPRSDKGWRDPSIAGKKQQYESLLVRRNAALLREAGVEAVVVGSLHAQSRTEKVVNPVWQVVMNEMPTFDTRAPWEDVLDFRAEDRTKHLVRSLRRWIRKIVIEDWSEAELEDEVRELIYEYETHLRLADVRGGTGVWTCMITGIAGLTEDVVKLRISKIAGLVTAFVDRKAKLLEAELGAPGRELALIPELRTRFS
jgi:hypothetical protein